MRSPTAAQDPGRPRVAVVTSSLKLAGAEKQTVYLSRALVEAGLDTVVFHLGEGGHYEPVLRQMGIAPVRIFRQNRPLSILARLGWALCRYRPAVVFAPQFGDLLQAGLAGRLSRALVLGGVRSDGFYELNSQGRRSPFMLRLAHGLVANSHRAARNLVSRGIALSKIKILPNVLDLQDFDTRSQQPPPIAIPAGRVVAVAVGSLQPCKRLDRFLSALALARRQAPSLLGVIAGADCGSRPALEQAARELGLWPHHVVFAGECHNVPALLAQAGFLVLCSEYEGFPNVILEAMAAGLPVISTPGGDAARLVLPGRTGFVVEGAQIEALARSMAELARDPGTRARFGAEGRGLVAREYSYETLSGRLLRVVCDFAAQQGRHHLVHRLEREAAPKPAKPRAAAWRWSQADA